MIEAAIPGIVARAGYACVSVRQVQGGATCSAWAIETGDRGLFLRVFNRRARKVPLALELEVIRHVQRQGLPVADPVLWSVDAPGVLPGVEWALDGFVAGSHPPRGGLLPAQAELVGQVLACLHGFEPADASLVPGVRERFDDPLPATPSALNRHLLIRARPDLREKVVRAVDRIGEVSARSACVLCHGDLHERQFLCQGDRLLAVLDFGEMAWMNPLWDLGSLAYFQGQTGLWDVLGGYCDTDEKRAELFDLGQVFSAGIALHHASRSRLPGKEDRLARAVGHLERLGV